MELVKSIYKGFEGVSITENKLQQYIVANPFKFGLSDLKYLCGKGGGGGDFSGFYEGKKIKIEVEWVYSDYYNHIGVPRFKDVEMLICIDGIYPSNGWRKILPPIIKYYNLEDFNNWLTKNYEYYCKVKIHRFSYNQNKKHPTLIIPQKHLDEYLYYKTPLKSLFTYS
jgi:hypothetical protein